MLAVALLSVAFLSNFILSAIAGLGGADAFGPQLFVVALLQALVVGSLVVLIVVIVLDLSGAVRRAR